MSAGIAWLGTIGAKGKWSAPHVAMGMAPVLGGAMMLLSVDPGDPTGVDVHFTQLAAHRLAALDCSARPVSGDSEEPRSDCNRSGVSGLVGQSATGLFSMLAGLPNTDAASDDPPAIPGDRKSHPYGGSWLANAAGPVPALPQGAADHPDGHGKSLGLNMLNDSMIVGQNPSGARFYGVKQSTATAQAQSKVVAAIAVVSRVMSNVWGSKGGQHGSATSAATAPVKSGALGTGSSGPIGFIGNLTHFASPPASGSPDTLSSIAISSSTSTDFYSGISGSFDGVTQTNKSGANPASSSHGISPSTIAATPTTLTNFSACTFSSGEFNPSNEASFIAQNGLPDIVVAGQNYNVSVTFLNTGQTTWTASSNYKLGFTGQNTTWGLCRVWLDVGDSIAPGEQKIFSFPVTAPTTPGSYDFQWQMVQEGSSAFGNPSSGITVNVVAGGN